MNFTAPSNRRNHNLIGDHLNYCNKCKVGYLSNYTNCLNCTQRLKNSSVHLLGMTGKIISYSRVASEWIIIARCRSDGFTYTNILPMADGSRSPTIGAKVKIVVRKARSTDNNPLAYIPKFFVIS